MNKENLNALLEDFEKVSEFFYGDHEKALFWFTTKNPHFGEWEPILLYMINRGHKVTGFIDNWLDENEGEL